MFAAAKQSGSREVIIADRKYQIGGFHPMRRDFHPPALDVRHARAIFCLLSFRNPFEPNRLIRFSFNEFCRRFARSNGGRYARAISLIVADLLDAYIRVTDLTTKISHQYRLIEHIDIESRPIRRKDSRLAESPQEEMWFNGATLSNEFFGMLDQIAELQHLDLNVFTSIRSPLAQAIYLYIPSRAYHHGQNDPFEISLTKLLEQVSFPVPQHKSKRRQLFTKHEEQQRSIMQQLDGVATLSGCFRVALIETADAADWKLQAWIEKPLKKRQDGPGASKLIQAYIAAGGNRSRLDGALARAKSLSEYELELLERASIEVDGNERFFQLAKAVLGEAVFVELLAEAKGDQLEGRRARKTPTARLIFRIMQAASATKA